MKVGQLIWDANTQRVDIVYRDGTFYGGLHCGDTFEVLIKDKWQATRIELRWPDTWYLTGFKCDEEFLGLIVRKGGGNYAPARFENVY